VTFKATAALLRWCVYASWPMTGSTLSAPGSGRPFENFLSGALLAHGFIVDMDLLWAASGQGDIAQFDFVASAGSGQLIQRVIVECKGGDRWGYADAFQLLGQLRMIGAAHAILFVAHRWSIDRVNRTPAFMDRQFAPFGLYVIPIRVDDRMPATPVIDIDELGRTLFARGFMPMANSDMRIDAVEACARGIARLRGAMDRVADTLKEPMSPVWSPASNLLRVVRDWTILSGDPVGRFLELKASLAASNTSQVGWNPEAGAAHRHFSRDVALVELYAAAQAVAALTDAIRSGWSLPKDLSISRQLRQLIPTLDLHAIARAAYILCLAAPWSDLAIAARRSYGPAVAELAVSRRLRQRCRDPRRHRDKAPTRSREDASRP
jgi:hypothetical protein